MIEQLPTTWTYARLDQVAVVVAGNPAPQGFEHFANGEFNFVRVHDMGANGNSALLTNTRDLINATAAVKMRLIPSNSVLFTKSGASTLLNQRAILAKDSYVVSHIAAALPSKGVESKWLFYFLQLVDFATLAHATNMPSLPLSRAKAIRVPIAPTNEQARIIASIEELLSELDKGIESFKTAREQLKVYRQAVLKHAFEGKLTEEWRKKHVDELESAETLLEKIKVTREQRYRQQLDDWKRAVKTWEASGKEGKKPTKPGKPKELPPLIEAELSELPELPEGWGWVRLSRISENIQIGPFGSLLHKADYVSNGTPLVNPSHIKDQRIEPDWNFAIPEKKIKSLRKYVMNENDIVMGRRGEMGRCAVVSEKENGWLCGTGSLFVRLLPSTDSGFYCYVLSSRQSKDFLSGNSIGTTMQNLNQKILHNVPVPFCNLKEQNEVIQQIESRLSVAEKLEQEIEDGLKQAEALRQSLLKKAFEGRLVPQDPNDEPASVLLARIKTETAKPKKNARKEKKAAV